uniref:peroxidase n=2 Tax=Wuchereria bancrofti TaxID=6293 RepID=A0AAF5Q2S6_WUCBA
MIKAICIQQLQLILLFLTEVVPQLSSPQTSKFKCLPNGCCDEHQWCRFWASIGECTANPDWMTGNCQLACNTCNAGIKDDHLSSPINSGDCSAINSTDKNLAENMIKNHRIISVEDTSRRKLLSIDDITKAVGTGCVPKLTETDCARSLCYHLMYRSFDGVCNNLEKPLLGAAFRPYFRHLPAEYDDKISEPVSSIRNTRPTAREVSRILLSSSQSVPHDKYNALMMQFGQFMSHDIAKTTLQPSAKCTSCKPVPSICMPIPISVKDDNEAFKQRHCLKVSRSSPICGTGRNGIPREQLNENTAFIDASPLYGSSLKDVHKFRQARTGFLRMNKFNNQMVLPFDQSKCSSPQKCTATFTAGDIRVNLFIGLSSVHILFTREHNRIATILQKLNPDWSGDRLFQETRKIVGAEIQVITYNEFLPKILGNTMDKHIGSYKGYNSKINPTVSNVFTTSAYRFGHGMLQEFYQRLDFAGNNISHGGFLFGDGVFKSRKILFEGGIDPILRGFMMTPVKRPHRMSKSITEKMFGSTDLGSVNIQRGRDHGLPSFNKWRHFCGMPLAHNFDDLKNEILDKNIRHGLSRTYKTVDDIDLYIGSMVEDPVIGGLVGTTLACLIGDQFKRLRDGDRFYYENPGIFTAAQLAELRKVTLASIICNNGDQFGSISQDAFLIPKGHLTKCSAISQIDLTKWRE